MQPGRSRDYGLYRRVGGTHVGRRRPTSTVERQTSWTTPRLRADAHGIPLGVTHVRGGAGPIGVIAAHVTPRKIRLVISSRFPVSSTGLSMPFDLG